MRITCVGLSTVDMVYRVPHIPGPDEKAQATAVSVAAGGPALNAAVTAAALGADVTLVTAVGAHPLGDLIRSDLDGYAVRLVDAAPHHTAPPPVSAVTVEEGTGRRTIVSRNAADAGVGVPAGLDLTGVVLVDGHHPALAAAAATGGGRVIADAGHWRPVFATVLPHAWVVAASAGFRLPSGAPLSTAAPLVAVTDGERPVRWWSPDAEGTIEVPPVAAADTSGAGDAFHGALAVALAAGGAFPDALREAVRVAAIRVEHPGPRAWLADPRLRRPG